jgi:uncharacterized protein
MKRFDWKSFLRRLLTINGTPPGIAGGFALGLFLSVVPTFGLGMVAALALAPLLKLNLPATYAGTLIVNPFTGFFFYAADYFVGAWILGIENAARVPSTFAEAKDFILGAPLPWYLGGIILAAVLSLVAYVGLFLAARGVQNRRRSVRPGRDDAVE